MPDSTSPTGWLSPEAFTSACAALPLVSVDVYLTRQQGGGTALLLGRRANRPAQGWWFTPGGRIRKQEPLPQALARVLTEELALPAAGAAHARLLGAWDHFYPDSAFAKGVPTHYVNLAYQLHWEDVAGMPSAAAGGNAPPAEAWPVGTGAQHLEWRWWALPEAVASGAKADTADTAHAAGTSDTADAAFSPGVHPHVKAVLPLLRQHQR